MVEQHSLGHDMETKRRAKPILWAREMQKRALGVYIDIRWRRVCEGARVRRRTRAEARVCGGVCVRKHARAEACVCRGARVRRRVCGLIILPMPQRPTITERKAIRITDHQL